MIKLPTIFTRRIGAMPRNKKKRVLRPVHTLVICLFGAIVLGTALLMIPAATRPGEVTTFHDALFTATSALSVTGITLFDTYSHWSLLGQVILLFLIEIGGLGFVVIITFFNIIIGRRLGLLQATDMMMEYSTDSIEFLRSLYMKIVTYSFILQAACAVTLMFTFVPRCGGYGVFMSVFTSCSAFCNAGFDIMGTDAAGNSLSFIEYAGNGFVILPVAFIIILGGLGFIVWQDLLNFPTRRRVNLHTKVVLVMTVALIALGFFAYLYELFDDPQFADSTVTEKVLSAFLTSVAARTAGMTALPVDLSANATLIVTMLLMFIGTGPGSTGGGTKVTTWAIMFATVGSVIANREDPVLFGYKVKKNLVYKTMTVLALSMFTVFGLFTVVFLSGEADRSIKAIDIMYDIVSAFSTTGFSTNLALHSGSVTYVVLLAAMFVGRIGPVSLMLFLSMSKPKIRPEVLPESKIMVG